MDRSKKQEARIKKDVTFSLLATGFWLLASGEK
jgi:hypothetical protein